jgi:phosphatidylserine/phosphatidylglycerophosphate/cardiolipin synthase-like enzyme
MTIIPLDNPKSFFNAILSTIDHATKDDELILNYFVIRQDQIGLSLLARLFLAIERQVTVKLIIDDYGSLHPSCKGTEYAGPPISTNTLAFLKSRGCRIYCYNRIESTKIYAPSNILNWSRFSRRDHSKIFAFNLRKLGKCGIVVGDSQWAQEHFSDKFRGNNAYILDEQAFHEAKKYCESIIGSPASHSSFNFLDNSNKLATEKELAALYLDTAVNHSWAKNLPHYRAESIQFVSNQLNFTNPQIRKTIQDKEIELLGNAQNTAHYTTPYFGPDTDLQDAFRACHRRLGRNFRIMIAKYNDNPYLPYGTKRAALNLIASGIQIHEYEGDGNIHYKDLIIDDISFIKSSNGEGRSRFFNLESGAIIKSNEYAEYNRRHFMADLKQTVLIHKNTKFIAKEKFLRKIILEAMIPFYYHHL